MLQREATVMIASSIRLVDRLTPGYAYNADRSISRILESSMRMECCTHGNAMLLLFHVADVGKPQASCEQDQLPSYISIRYCVIVDLYNILRHRC